MPDPPPEAGEVAEDVATEVVPVAEEAPGVHVETDEGPVGVSLIASFALTQPDFAVSAAGQATCLNVTPGLSEPPNQSKRQ